jgi:subtilisin family serine protease
MMKKTFTLICLLLACAYCFAQDRNNEDEVVKIDWYNQHANKEGELIVKFADHTPLRLQNDARGILQATGIDKVDALLQRYPVAKAERLCPNDNPNRELKTTPSYNGPDVVERDLSRLCRFVMQDPMQTYDLMEALKELPEVEFAEPNYMAFALGMENNTKSFSAPKPHGGKGQLEGDSYFAPATYMAEPMYSLQWGLQAVHLPELWAADTVTSNSDRKIIAILDTGVDIEHPDLAANIWTNPGENENGYDDDNNGFKDDIHGWDFVNKTGDMHDFNSHGTHCAGIAAAVGDNGIGMTGANPMAYIMPIAVLQSNGTGDVATIIQGINYAKNNGADVLSMSFGSYSYSIALEQALGQAYQNAVLVAAAGNDGKAIDPRCGQPQDMPMYPAAFTFVFGVEATQQVPGQCGYRTCWSNYDCDGPTFSQYGEEQLYNYELQAPGAAIYSTVPNGNYRNYSGTSMAAPLVAGGISALLHAKPYPSQEMMWGDLINTAGNHVNFKACYDMGEAPAQLDFVCFEMNDTLAGDGDYRPDAGETIELYPTLRSTWGATDNIMMWLTVDEYEDPDIVTFLDAEPVAFGQSLSAYAKSKSANPLRFTIDPDCADGRIINMVLHLTANPTQYQLNVHFSITVENGVELGGLVNSDMTLYPNVHYIMTSPLSVASGVTLTIKPGTVVKFKKNTGFVFMNNSHLIANGTPDSLITFTMADMDNGPVRRFTATDTIRYVKFDNLHNNDVIGDGAPFVSCIITNCSAARPIDSHLIKTNVYYTSGGSYGLSGSEKIENSNICNNSLIGMFASCNPNLTNTRNSNCFNNPTNGRVFSIGCDAGNTVYVSYQPSYLGSTSHSILREHVIDLYNPYIQTNTIVDLDALLQQPAPEAHGIVWKIVVNGYDAQDEFEQLPPLGCGRHQFEVYFNRPMDTLVTPMLSMGVRPPYTQHAIAEDGHWNEEGTIYTAYFTINGTSATDGLNRIYVANAKDDEHFEIPIENVRFNVQVASAGSLSNEFMATPGLGKVELEWNNNEVDFDDFLGYNMYRYRVIDTLGNHSDTLMLNTSLIQDTLFTDYNVEPGIRYYYFYKVLRTNLTEGEASLTVTTVPLTSIPGDANGSMAVDVADVVSLVSYLTNGNPQPFIFEAADVNSDGTIDILDIVGVINIITNRGSLPDKDPIATAYYSIENGVLFVDTPVELGGVQFVLKNAEFLEPLQALEGFEKVNATVSDGTLFMAYSMSGKRLPTGKHALLRIGEGTINSVALADPEGRNILAIASGTGIVEHEALYLEQPYPNPFTGSLTIPFIIADEQANNVVFTVSNMMGQTLYNVSLGSRTRGEYQYEWKPASNLATGIYMVSMQVNGQMVQRAKVVYVK